MAPRIRYLWVDVHPDDTVDFAYFRSLPVQSTSPEFLSIYSFPQSLGQDAVVDPMTKGWEPQGPALVTPVDCLATCVKL